MKILKIFLFSFSILLIGFCSHAQTGAPNQSVTVETTLFEGENYVQIPVNGTMLVLHTNNNLQVIGGLVTQATGAADSLDLVSGATTTTLHSDRCRILIIITDGHPAATATTGRQKNRRVEMEIVFE